MSIAQQINEILGHEDLSNFLSEQTAAINNAYATQQISDEERAALLEDLVRTNIVIQGASDQDVQIFLTRVLDVLKSAPIPS